MKRITVHNADLPPRHSCDSYAVFQVFRASIVDLGQRLNVQTITGGDDPEVMAQLWERRRPLFEHIAQTAEAFWLAERDGQVVAYARATLRDGLRQLTEFFVLPGEQAGGVGRELLARVFPAEGAQHRLIIASTDIRATARYMKTGIYPYFPAYHFGRTPEAVPVPADLSAEPLTPDLLETLAALDQATIAHRRDADHQWLMTRRPSFLYRRAGDIIGYGYHYGPFALRDAGDYPAVLAHIERYAAENDLTFGVEVPMINHAAVDYLLGRGCQMDDFFELVMMSEPFGNFDRYIFTSPPFFL